MIAFLSLVVAQALYTASDTWKKVIFGESGFSFGTLVSPAFLATLAVAAVGFLFQMYALSKVDLSRTIITMGVLAVIFSAGAGVWYLRETLEWWNWVGVGLAVGAIVLVNIK